jgi:hypothetical protein
MPKKSITVLIYHRHKLLEYVTFTLLGIGILNLLLVWYWQPYFNSEVTFYIQEHGV